MSDIQLTSAPSGALPADAPDYAAIYGWARLLLEETPQNLPDDGLRLLAGSTLRFLRAAWPCLPGYGGLTESDRCALDECAGHLIAARYRRKHPKRRGAGELARVKLGQREFEFGEGVAARKTLEEEWISLAYNALQQVACIAAILNAVRSVSLFQAAGRRREQAARGVNTLSPNPLFTILADEWDAERQQPLPLLLSDPFGY